MESLTDLPTSKTKSPQNTSKSLLKSFLEHKKQKKNFRFFSSHTLYMESCNGFADLENQKCPEHFQNPLKIIFTSLETKKKFSIFFAPYLIHGPPSVIDPHTLTTQPYIFLISFILQYSFTYAASVISLLNISIKNLIFLALFSKLTTCTTLIPRFSNVERLLFKN